MSNWKKDAGCQDWPSQWSGFPWERNGMDIDVWLKMQIVPPDPPWWLRWAVPHRMNHGRLRTLAWRFHLWLCGRYYRKMERLIDQLVGHLPKQKG